MAVLAEILEEKYLKQYIDTIGKITDVEFATKITTMNISAEEATLMIICYMNDAEEIGT